MKVSFLTTQSPPIAILVLLLTLAPMNVGSAEDSHATLLPKAKLEAFFQEYCIRCHGPEKQNGDVRFDQATWKIENTDVAQRWQDVLDVLNGGDMPPEDEKQPGSAKLAKTLEILTGTLQTARGRLTSQGGEIILRRLNRREYANTIRDLFGVEINPHDVPPDNDSGTFDTVGSDQIFTSSTFDRYLELGERIALQAFRLAATPRMEVEISRSEVGGESKVQELRRRVEEGDRQMAMKKAGATWKEMGFEDEGHAQILFKQWEARVERPRRYLQLPRVDQGLYLAEPQVALQATVKQDSIDPRGSYRVRLRGGIHGEQPEIRQFVAVTMGDRGHCVTL